MDLNSDQGVPPAVRNDSVMPIFFFGLYHAGPSHGPPPYEMGGSQAYPPEPSPSVADGNNAGVNRGLLGR